MSCDNYRASLIGLIYDDIDDAERAETVAHLASCAACRDIMAGLEATRSQLRNLTPDVPRAPRVLVVGPPATPKRAWLGFAAGIVAAWLAAGGTAAGYAYGSGRTAPTTPPANPAVAQQDIDRRVEQEVNRRWEALKTELASSRPAPAVVTPAAVTRDDLNAAMARLEKKIDGSRASDLDYMQNQIEASERRTGSWIGETQKALRYVALANDPSLSER